MLRRALALGLIPDMIFKGYEESNIPASYQVLYFSLELYAVVRTVSVVPMELAVLGVVSCCGV